MKVLLLGGIYSPWTMHFIEDYLQKNNCEIWMLHRSNRKEHRKYISFYRKKGVHLIDGVSANADIYGGLAKKNYLKVIRGHFLQIKRIMKSGHYDVINLHSVCFPDLVYAIILKYIMHEKVILSYWGSDLLRVNDKKLYIMGMFAKYADFVTFDNKDLEMKFRETYKWAYKVPSKTILFGLPVLDIINEKCKSISSADLRKKWKIPVEKTVIAVGYNGVLEQQHIKVLREIGNLEDKFKEQIFILLQMTYGATEAYRKQVVDAAKKTGCEYMEIKQFLKEDQVADLRIMTDIFINAQTTDAFSGTVCENLFAGTLLLNAEWLRYQEFKEYDFQYLEFKSINEIGQLIKTALEQEIEISKNKELVWKLRSWEHCAPKWKKVYHKVVNMKL